MTTLTEAEVEAATLDWLSASAGISHEPGHRSL